MNAPERPRRRCLTRVVRCGQRKSAQPEHGRALVEQASWHEHGNVDREHPGTGNQAHGTVLYALGTTEEYLEVAEGEGVNKGKFLAHLLSKL